MKKKAWLILILIGFCVMVYIIQIIRYNNSMDEQSYNWYKKEYIRKAITGVLIDIKNFNEDPNKVILTINNKNDKFDLTYGVTCVTDSFVKFVNIGDSVFKFSDAREMKFCKPSNQCMFFELNFCDKFR